MQVTPVLDSEGNSDRTAFDQCRRDHYTSSDGPGLAGNPHRGEHPGCLFPMCWFGGLPNEVFGTTDGKTFDGPGIPPDIDVPVFVDDDMTAGREPSLLQVIRQGGVTVW